MLLIGVQIGSRYEQLSLERSLREAGMLPASASGQVLADPQKNANISALWRVWRLLNENYIDPQKLQEQPLVQGAVEGLVRAVGDPYTVFMTPEENTQFRDSLSGNLQGIGAELTERDGDVIVVVPLKGSPAERAGVMPQDVLTEVNGESMEGLGLGDVVRRVRGPRGTTVRITVFRDSSPQPVHFEIVREDIHVPSVESRVIGSGSGTIGYVALNQFGEGSIDEVRRALESFREKKPKGLILDLRYNGGGYLDGAVDLVSLFLRDGKVVSVEHRKGAPQQHYVSGRPLYPDTPLIVLQNEGSASASEIAAGALQDYGRATVIGKKSFGKGTVQEVIDLPDDSSLRVTVARWLTPKGKDLGKEGVHPDIEIERTTEDLKAGRDPQLDAAVEWVTNKRVLTASGTVMSAWSSVAQ